MRERNLKVLSRRSCLKSARPGCVDNFSCLVVSSHEVINSKARATQFSYSVCLHDFHRKSKQK